MGQTPSSELRNTERHTVRISGGDQLNQHCENSFGKSLTVTDVCLYEIKFHTPGLTLLYLNN